MLLFSPGHCYSFSHFYIFGDTVIVAILSGSLLFILTLLHLWRYRHCCYSLRVTVIHSHTFTSLEIPSLLLFSPGHCYSFSHFYIFGDTVVVAILSGSLLFILTLLHLWRYRHCCYSLRVTVIHSHTFTSLEIPSLLLFSPGHCYSFSHFYIFGDTVIVAILSGSLLFILTLLHLWRYRHCCYSLRVTVIHSHTFTSLEIPSLLLFSPGHCYSFSHFYIFGDTVVVAILSGSLLFILTLLHLWRYRHCCYSLRVTVIHSHTFTSLEIPSLLLFSPGHCYSFSHFYIFGDTVIVAILSGSLLFILTLLHLWRYRHCCYSLRVTVIHSHTFTSLEIPSLLLFSPGHCYSFSHFYIFGDTVIVAILSGSLLFILTLLHLWRYRHCCYSLRVTVIHSHTFTSLEIPSLLLFSPGHCYSFSHFYIFGDTVIVAILSGSLLFILTLLHLWRYRHCCYSLRVTVIHSHTFTSLEIPSLLLFSPGHCYSFSHFYIFGDTVIVAILSGSLLFILTLLHLWRYRHCCYSLRVTVIHSHTFTSLEIPSLLLFSPGHCYSFSHFYIFGDTVVVAILSGSLLFILTLLHLWRYRHCCYSLRVTVIHSHTFTSLEIPSLLLFSPGHCYSFSHFYIFGDTVIVAILSGSLLFILTLLHLWRYRHCCYSLRVTVIHSHTFTSLEIPSLLLFSPGHCYSFSHFYIFGDTVVVAILSGSLLFILTLLHLWRYRRCMLLHMPSRLEITVPVGWALNTNK